MSWCHVDTNTPLLGCLCHGKRNAAFSGQAHQHKGRQDTEMGQGGGQPCAIPQAKGILVRSWDRRWESPSSCFISE